MPKFIRECGGDEMEVRSDDAVMFERVSFKVVMLRDPSRRTYRELLPSRCRKGSSSIR